MSLPENRTVIGDCGHLFRAQVWRSVNTSNPELVERFLQGTLNFVKCPIPTCGQLTDVRSPFLYHDLRRGLMVFIYDPDRDDDDPLLTLDKRLTQAFAADGVETISADSFEAAREAIGELEDQSVLSNLRCQHPQWSEAKVCAGYIHDAVENSYYNQAIRALRELGRSAEDDEGPVGPPDIGAATSDPKLTMKELAAINRGDTSSISPDKLAYYASILGNSIGEAKEVNSSEQIVSEDLDATGENKPYAGERAIRAGKMKWTPESKAKYDKMMSSYASQADTIEESRESAHSNTIAHLGLRERIANFVALLLLLPIIAASLYLWLGALGGGSLQKGLGVAGAICAFIAIATLPKEPAWAKLIKSTVLTAGVLWVASTFLPITDVTGFVLALLIAGVVGVLGYVVLFENFFD
jgi:hypothetical protein